ncbi:MAG TPA: nucleic acid-binding protein [Planktothrix sp. UBA8407]|nr:nucleic acid-binding protein [Planktothrix sp. UBA8407]HBK21203.1 nucleic acid-binding protein [Planktothrix sp. UBA10369]
MMSLWVLDTDHISLFQRQHPQVLARLSNINIEHRAVTIITLEEQVRGRLDMIGRVKSVDGFVQAYINLWETVKFFQNIHVLDFDQQACNCYKEMKRQKIRIGTQDLKIASIVLSQQGILVTRNRKDFEKIPNLLIEDWTI